MIESMSGILVILTFIAFYYFASADERKQLKANKRQAEVSIRQKFDDLLKASNAEILGEFCDQKGANIRDDRRAMHMRREGTSEDMISSGGFIYVVACKPKTISYRWRYGEGITEPENFQTLAKKAKDITQTFPTYNLRSEKPYKIGFTTRDVQTRISELNDSMSSNYSKWIFSEEVVNSIWVDKDIEIIEKRIHRALHKLDACVLGEIFCVPWLDIDSIIQKIIGQPLELSHSQRCNPIGLIRATLSYNLSEKTWTRKEHSLVDPDQKIARSDQEIKASVKNAK
jgi:hypothetical protein